MANRYWVGGTANWDGTAGTKWAATSAGPGGETVPTSADDVFFDGGSGANTVTIAVGNTGAKSITCTGFTGTLAGSAGITVSGNVTLVSGMTVTYTGTITFNATATITSAGKTLGGLTINGSGINVSLGDALTLSGTITLTQGTFTLSNYNATASAFTSSNTNTRSIAFGTGNISVTGAGGPWNTTTVTNLTTSGTPVVNVTYSSATTTSVNTGALNEANSISFNVTAGTGTFNILQNASDTIKSLNFTGFTGNWSSKDVATIYGDLVISAGMAVAGSSGAISFGATSGTKTITTGGKTFDFPININGAGGTFKLLDNFTVGNTSGRNFTLTNGTLDLNGQTLTLGTGATNIFQTAAGTKNITFNGGTIIVQGASTTSWNNAAPTGFTTTAGTGTGKISMTAATAKTFVGGGSTYNCTLSNDGAGALTITGSNTFTTLANGVQPTTFTFTAGTTTTLTNWNVSGTAGNLVTIGSATAASHTLSKSSGTVSADYLSISRSTATGGATWYAGANSTDGGNNTGWIFTAPPSTATGNFFMLFN